MDRVPCVRAGAQFLLRGLAASRLRSDPSRKVCKRVPDKLAIDLPVRRPTLPLSPRSKSFDLYNQE
jgi:hypothetical protein